MWHLLVVLVPKALMYVASKQQWTNTLSRGNSPIPEPCRLALRPSSQLTSWPVVSTRMRRSSLTPLPGGPHRVTAPLAQRLQPYDVRLLTNALGLDAPSPPTFAPSIRGALPLPIWKKIVFLHNSCCFYCGFHTYDLAQEHLVPVSRGGLTTPDNIVPACMKCNQRKATMTAHEFFATTTRLEKQALLQKRREHEAQPLASLIAQMSLAVDRDHSKHG